VPRGQELEGGHDLLDPVVLVNRSDAADRHVVRLLRRHLGEDHLAERIAADVDDLLHSGPRVLVDLVVVVHEEAVAAPREKPLHGRDQAEEDPPFLVPVGVVVGLAEVEDHPGSFQAPGDGPHGRDVQVVAVDHVDLVAQDPEKGGGHVPQHAEEDHRPDLLAGPVPEADDLDPVHRLLCGMGGGAVPRQDDDAEAGIDQRARLVVDTLEAPLVREKGVAEEHHHGSGSIVSHRRAAF